MNKRKNFSRKQQFFAVRGITVCEEEKESVRREREKALPISKNRFEHSGGGEGGIFRYRIGIFKV